MCVAIALTYSELPLLLIEQRDLQDRVHCRGGEKEVQFHWAAAPAVLPVWWGGKLHVVRWGNKDRAERKLPMTAWTRKETVESGWWKELAPEPVEIPASYGLANGVWFKVKVGMQGLLVHDQRGSPLVFMVCETATRYYRVMTRCEWQPVLIDEVI